MTSDAPHLMNDFDATVRLNALQSVTDTVTVTPAAVPQVNMHCHSFFSYNGYDASPSRIVYEAKRNDWFATGLCDFDVLDGMREFLDAGDLLGVRCAANMETRTFFPEYADKEINSPGEPGVYYFMGAGFVRLPKQGSAAEATLAAMRKGAESRNRGMLKRINAALDGFQLNYDTDVLPLTPNGNATERHVCSAFHAKSRSQFNEDQWVEFWTRTLGVDSATIASLYDDAAEFGNACRSKLMKAGGPGYVQPNEETFPPLQTVIDMILECGAIPMATWLDGTTAGEANITELLECQVAKGIAALNIVPDRNWNIKDPEVSRKKAALFVQCVDVANAMDLPVNVGTELNKFGQPWVDDFTGGPMPQLAATFLKGAQIMIGHSRLLDYAEQSYLGDWAASEFVTTAAKNDFFAAVGKLPVPPLAVRQQLRDTEPTNTVSTLADAAKKGAW
jgi:hypothetical protein